MSERRPGIADVARAAGVSASTASVVFSGKAPVSQATRGRVLSAAAELGYTGPDPRAASLRRGRSGIVGVLFMEPLRTAFLDPVKTAMMDGLTEGVAALGAGLLLLHDDATGNGDLLTSAPIDAVVVINSSDAIGEALALLRARGVPIVVIEGDAAAGVPRIGLNDREAQRLAAAHLAQLGHRHVVVLALPPRRDRARDWLDADDEIRFDVTRDRLAGARDLFPDAAAFAVEENSIDEGVRAGRALLSSRERPTAVIAQSDLLAAGVIRAAEDAGLRVPEDVSVTGFDGVRVDGLDGYELTTLVQPAFEKGRAAGAAVARMLAGEEAASITFTCTFREGTTTAPVRIPSVG
ncbi:substrate-binding domain-containing protein [Microbacterium sediminicola]|uniref:Substrate-binding domain-containing protein n=1 Tax=Microbacterium sediminicola TaxID=415210 RepID=A0ABP4UE89_9MICO